MPTLKQKIAETFFARISKSKEVDAGKIAQLKALFAEAKKVKAEELVKIFTLPDGGDLH
ncbi:MAG TPA: hypothetical protein VKF81_14980 [Blastocatellia bacterium]|nr:hypothetical protein [Blastocatellia bacterium]